MDRIFGKDSFCLENDSVRAYVTQTGGHMAPVYFYTDSDEPVQPYYIAPWFDETLPETATNLQRVLRGDLFSFPFGSISCHDGINYPGLGPTANEVWKAEHEAPGELLLSMQFPPDDIRVTKHLFLKNGHNCVYSEHIIENCEGNLPYAHHPTLDCSETMYIASSEFSYGQVAPNCNDPFSESIGYCSLKGGEQFQSLKELPTHWKNPGYTDGTVFPARKGFGDIIQITGFSEPITWLAASCPKKGYIWFSIRKTGDFPSNLIWYEYNARQRAPWSIRTKCLALESICSCFCDGVPSSTSENIFNGQGYPTAGSFTKSSAVSLRFVQGVVRIPEEFGRIEKAKIMSESIVFTGENGISVEAPVDISFLK